MNKIYVLLHGIPYEGYGPPIGIFSTLELAMEAVNARPQTSDDTWLGILEYCLNDPEHQVEIWSSEAS
jgi:hypothetical protein